MILIWGDWITNNASLIESPYEMPQDTMLFPKRLLEICMHLYLNIYGNYICKSESWICWCAAADRITSCIRLWGCLLLSSKVARWLEFLDVPVIKLGWGLCCTLTVSAILTFLESWTSLQLMRKCSCLQVDSAPAQQAGGSGFLLLSKRLSLIHISEPTRLSW